MSQLRIFSTVGIRALTLGGVFTDPTPPRAGIERSSCSWTHYPPYLPKIWQNHQDSGHGRKLRPGCGLGGSLWRPQDWALPGLTVGCSSEACSGYSNSTFSRAWTAADAQAPGRMLLWPVGSGWSPTKPRGRMSRQMITKGLGLLKSPLKCIRNRKEEKGVAEHFPRWKKKPHTASKTDKRRRELIF